MKWSSLLTTLPPNLTLNRLITVLWLLLIGQPLQAQLAELLPQEINSEYEEREPTFSPDGKTMYFWRRKNPANVAGVKDNGDIWMSKWVKGTWSQAVHPGIPLNTPQQNFVWQVSQNHDTLWTNRILYIPGQKDAGLGYHVRDKNGNWSEQQHCEIEDYFFAGQYKDYFICPGRILLVTTASEDGLGGTDIWVCYPLNDTTWSKPQNMGAMVNTAGDEDAPYLSKDGKTLYFSSNGHGTGGDHDIYYATRLDNTWLKWSKPKPVGRPINSIGYDYDFQLSPDERFAYWCSDQNTLGSNDIFRLDLHSCDLTLYPENEVITLCKGDSVVLEAGFTLGNPSYRWMRNGELLGGAYDRSLVVREKGVYQIIRVKEACSDTSEAKTVLVKDVPFASISGQTHHLCENDSVLLMAFSQEENSYQWLRNGRLIPRATEAKIFAKVPGDYSVRVSNGHCARHSEVFTLKPFENPQIGIENEPGKTDSSAHWTSLISPQYSVKDFSFRSLEVSPQGLIYVVGILDESRQRSLRVEAYDKKGLLKWSTPQLLRRYNSAAYTSLDEEGNLIIASNDCYLYKFSPNGNVLWQKPQYMEGIGGVCTDANGNIFTTGRFRDTLNIDGQEAIPGSRGNIFLAKHTPKGKLLWLRSIPCDKPKHEFGNMVKTDCAGNIYLAGSFDKIANFIQPVLRSTTPDNHFFIAKYSTEGRLMWAKKLTAAQSILSAGDFQTDCGGNVYFLANNKLFKLSPTGNMVWNYQLNLSNACKKITLQVSNEKIYISGLLSMEDTHFILVLDAQTGKQEPIWKGKQAADDDFEELCLRMQGDGSLYFAGAIKGRALLGSSPSDKSGASLVVARYSFKSENPKKPSIKLCPGDSTTLVSVNKTDLPLQWYRDGKPIPGALFPKITIKEGGKYTLTAKNKACTLVSAEQEIVFDCKQPKTPPLPSEPVVASQKEPKQNPTKEIAKTENEPKPIKESPKTKAPKQEKAVVELQKNKDGVPKALKNRKVKLQNTLEVESNQLKIAVWDYAAEDNDTISLNINGQWVLENHRITKKKKWIILDFDPKEDNYIFLYAHNLGAIPPNTVNLSINDGKTEQTSKLESDLKNCGYLRIRRKGN